MAKKKWQGYIFRFQWIQFPWCAHNYHTYCVEPFSFFWIWKHFKSSFINTIIPFQFFLSVCFLCFSMNFVCWDSVYIFILCSPFLYVKLHFWHNKSKENYLRMLRSVNCTSNTLYSMPTLEIRSVVMLQRQLHYVSKVIEFQLLSVLWHVFHLFFCNKTRNTHKLLNDIELENGIYLSCKNHNEKLWFK